jgi:glycine/D-amino acid oxidase-like deaminating enzyme
LIALGYNGRGVAMATAMGGIIARRIAGEAPDSLDMPVTAITPMRLHAFWPLAVQGTIAWGRLRDRLGV